MVEVSRKPSSVPPGGHPPFSGDHSSTTTVADRLQQPTRRLGRVALPPTDASVRRRGAPVKETPCLPTRPCSRWGLPCRPRYRGRGGLLPHPFTLTARVPRLSARCEDGGLFSVALSSASPPPGVTRHRTLWSSDFPLAPVAFTPAASDRLFDFDAATLSGPARRLHRHPEPVALERHRDFARRQADHVRVRPVDA